MPAGGRLNPSGDGADLRWLTTDEAPPRRAGRELQVTKSEGVLIYNLPGADTHRFGPHSRHEAVPATGGGPRLSFFNVGFVGLVNANIGLEIFLHNCRHNLWRTQIFVRKSPSTTHHRPWPTAPWVQVAQAPPPRSNPAAPSWARLPPANEYRQPPSDSGPSQLLSPRTGAALRASISPPHPARRSWGWWKGGVLGVWDNRRVFGRHQHGAVKRGPKSSPFSPKSQ